MIGFLLIDAIGTLALLAFARRNPVLRARLDYAFGRLIKRPAFVQERDHVCETEESDCPFCE